MTADNQVRGPIHFDALWREYQNGVRALLQAKLADPDQVDDLLQEVFIKVHRNLDSLKSEHSVKPWLFRIANNAIADFYRARNKSPDLSADDLWYDDEPEVEHGLAQCIVPFIKALPQETAELLIAIDLQGKSQKDYAKNLGISYSGLKSRVQRGRAQLRDLFEACCEFTFDKYGTVIDCEEKPPHCNDC